MKDAIERETTQCLYAGSHFSRSDLWV